MIRSINTLPDDSGKKPISPVSPGISPGIGKETEGITFSDSELGIKDTGIEMELPKEIESIGVKTQPTVVPIPANVKQMGVKPAGQNITFQIPPVVTLPLSEHQIAMGLHTSVVNSFRWLAEWCRKKLLVIGIRIK